MQSTPIDQQVLLYLQTRGEKKFNVGIPHRLVEVSKLKWFWKTLGLNKVDLLKLHPEWLDEIYLTGIGFDNYEADKISGKLLAQGSTVKKGNTQVTKIL